MASAVRTTSTIVNRRQLPFKQIEVMNAAEIVKAKAAADRAGDPVAAALGRKYSEKPQGHRFDLRSSSWTSNKLWQPTNVGGFAGRQR
jgi:uncharacterized protein with von Willebrand factor type A (vWA) domain